jgi:protein TonB
MKSAPNLGRALALSVVLHAAAIAAGMQLTARALWTARPPQPDLKVSLRAEPELPAAPRPELILPRETPRNSSAAVLVRVSRPLPEVPGRPAAVALPLPGAPQLLEGEAALKAGEQLRRELPYPAEAIARGLQGEALVLLFLDAAGNAIAARLEASSGYALLDDAAVSAARSLRSLPASAPREALVPVRFRLR